MDEGYLSRKLDNSSNRSFFALTHMSTQKYLTTVNSPTSNSQQLLTKDELAERLRLTRRGVECLVARKLIPIIRISHRCVRFSWDAVKAALAKLEVKEIGR